MRTRLALTAGAALVAGLFAVPSSANTTPPTTIDKCIPSVPETDPLEAGKVDICYSLHKPASATAETPVPVVLHSHGWGGSRSKNASSFTKWLEAGFAVLSFDQRGFGESGGKAHVEDPAFEGRDVIAIIDEVATYPWVLKNTTTTTVPGTGTNGNGRGEAKGHDKDKANGVANGHRKSSDEGKGDTTVTTVDPKDPVLGAIGGSYGGGYQFVGAFTELMTTGKTRFDALAPEITWFDLNESLAPQDVVRTLWGSLLYAGGANAHTSTVHQGFATGSATGQWPAELRKFFEDNGPSFHVRNKRKLDLPVLFGQGATDNLFPLDQGLKNFDQALTPEARAKSVFIGYNGGHVLQSVVPAGTGTGGDPCSKKLGGGNSSFSDVAVKFMRTHLKGETGLLGGQGLYHLALADGVTCATVDSVRATKTFDLGTKPTTVGVGVPVAHEIAAGPMRIAGTPTVDALVTALGVNAKAFMALSVGTSPADAKVVQHNTLPLHEALPVVGAKRRIELPSIAVDVPAGQKLFLTISPVADMYVGHGSRTPGAVLLEQVKVNVPVQ